MGNATRRTELIELDDEGRSCYTLSQFGLYELEALESYIQGRIIAAGHSSVEGIKDPAEKLKLMQPVIEAASQIRLDTEEGFKYLDNIPGLVRMLYYSLKPKHPKMTLEECRQLLQNHGHVFIPALVDLGEPRNGEALKNGESPRLEARPKRKRYRGRKSRQS